MKLRPQGGAGGKLFPRKGEMPPENILDKYFLGVFNSHWMGGNRPQIS